MSYQVIEDKLNGMDMEEAKHLLSSGKTIANQKFEELKKYAEEGGYNWRVLGLGAGWLMMLNGFFSVLFEMTRLSPLMALLNIYLFLFGCIGVMLENREQPVFKKYVDIIRRELHLLYLPYGRGAFYGFCGSLLFAKGGIISMLSGVFVFAVGVILYLSNKNAHEELARMRESMFDSRKIAATFQEFDKDNDGCLTSEELASLCQSLGSPLDYNTLESAILLLDTNGDNKIQYEEFLAWYKIDK